MTMDFNNAASVKQLTISLLKQDFGLRVELPNDRLCPPVPNRHDFFLNGCRDEVLMMLGLIIFCGCRI